MGIVLPDQVACLSHIKTGGRLDLPRRLEFVNPWSKSVTHLITNPLHHNHKDKLDFKCKL